jgi:hypothetical protein
MTAPKIETVGLQMPADIAEEIRTLAKANERSLSAEIRIAIKAHLASVAERAA